MQLLISLAGIFVLVVCAWALSENRKAINWRTVGGALILQASFAALVLYVPVGQMMLGAMSSGIASVLGFADEGIKFLFGDLATSGFIFAVRVLPLVIFISALISLLYYLGAMQWVIKVIGGGIQKALVQAVQNLWLLQATSSFLRVNHRYW